MINKKKNKNKQMYGNCRPLRKVLDYKIEKNDCCFYFDSHYFADYPIEDLNNLVEKLCDLYSNFFCTNYTIDYRCIRPFVLYHEWFTPYHHIELYCSNVRNKKYTLHVGYNVFDLTSKYLVKSAKK